jgi:CheY-like chemotaxis protein
MATSAWPSERPILVATSYPAEALVLRAAIEETGWPVAIVEDAGGAMQALCRRPEGFAALVVGDRAGRTSGLTLCGLARDAGYRPRVLLLTTEESALVAGRAARLNVSVLWQPVSACRLDRALREFLPRRWCVAC